MKTIATLLAWVCITGLAQAADKFDYRVLATSKTSTMEKEMNDAGDAGFRFSEVMGGNTAVGGKEVVVVMAKEGAAVHKKRYKLLATSKTSTMQKEMQDAGNEGFDYLGQTVFQTAFGGQEVVVILELDPEKGGERVEYQLLATSKTSTMQKELQEAGGEGFELVGVTVSKTAFGGAEIVSILRRSGE